MPEQTKPIVESNRFIALNKYTREWIVAEVLPYEIELRQKQYAYYRKKLLNFPQFPSSGGVAGEA